MDISYDSIQLPAICSGSNTHNNVVQHTVDFACSSQVGNRQHHGCKWGHCPRALRVPPRGSSGTIITSSFWCLSMLSQQQAVSVARVDGLRLAFM